MSNLATLKPFKKGKDPNRNVTGLNRGSKWLTTKLEDALRQKADNGKETYSDLLVKRELKNAIVDGEQRAIEHIWDRVEGKPVQADEPISGGKTLIVIIAGESAARYGVDVAKVL